MFLGKNVFVISEIGSNHNADLELCKKMIRKAKECGADAVKLQKRNNKELFMKSILNAPYQSEYAKETGTYGEHRECLDWFGKKEFEELITVAKEEDILLFATPFDINSADFLYELDMPLYKIASCHFNEYNLIKHVAGFGKPIILSTGGATYADMKFTYKFLKDWNAEFAFLHCISLYPNDDNLDLNCIRVMKKMFHDIQIGFSTHHPGILPLFLSYVAGARIIEAHFTLSRAYGGTDHGFSLEPQALRKLCYDIKRIPAMMGDGNRIVSKKEQQGFIWKFGKAVHPIAPIKTGEILTRDNIGVKAPADGLPPSRFDDLLGKVAICDLSTADVLTEDKIK